MGWGYVIEISRKRLSDVERSIIDLKVSIDRERAKSIFVAQVQYFVGMVVGQGSGRVCVCFFLQLNSF